MLYLFVHTSIVAELNVFVNDDLCICGKAPRAYFLIYILYSPPRPYTTPPCRLFPSILSFIMPLFYTLIRPVLPDRVYMGV